MIEDFARCYRAVASRDPRFDGWFFTAVTSTGIYCRPSCPATTPKPENVRFYSTAAAAQGAGFRACRRCRPDATPGSPEWDVRADVVGRAMRLIADGVVDREGVPGLAKRLGYSERHLHRQLVAAVGAGPLALARAQRAQTARILIETTTLPLAHIAFAAGFASIRQFNDTVREVFASTPTRLRHTRRRDGGPGAPGTVTVRLPYRSPLDVADLLGFLGTRAVPGVEEITPDGVYRRTLRLPHGTGIAALTPGEGHVRCVLRLDDVRDVAPAVARCRRLLDLDADPAAVADVLRHDPLLRPLVRKGPGRRVPGAVDGTEVVTRAILGQQISVAGARTLAARLTARFGQHLPNADVDGALTHVFPATDRLAELPGDGTGMPAARARTLRTLMRSIADGELTVDPGADRMDVERRLLAVPGIGPWTASYIGLRGLRDPDAFPAGDLGVRRAMERLGGATDIPTLIARAEAWRPWRAYATIHLWAA